MKSERKSPLPWRWPPASLWVTGVLLSMIGCGKLAPAEGTATLDGQPLSDASISLVPEIAAGQKDGRRPATGLTDEQGRFKLETVNRRGVMPGKYKVVVSKRILPPGVPPPKESQDWVRVKDQWKELLPAAYTLAEQTPVRIDLPPEGKTDIQLELVSAPAAEK